MFPLFLGAYLFILVVLWGFFLLAKHHAFKYKHYSEKNVPLVTNILFIILIVLSVSGFISLFFLGDNEGSSSRGEVQIQQSAPVNVDYY